jgi:NitT/TauT family transport system substrate-binding protein
MQPKTRKKQLRSCWKTTPPVLRPRKHQIRMVGEINKLVDGSDGTLDMEAYERTVKSLLSGGSDPVITKEPEGATTTVVTDKL